MGKGPTDYGQQRFGSTEWEEGPLQTIIRKSDPKKNLEFSYATKDEVRNVKIQRRTGVRLKGHGVKAFKLCEIARQKGNIDYIICYIDVDRDPGSRKSEHEARNRVQEIHDDIMNGFQQYSVERSQSSIPMVPCKMIESWLLSDGQAFRRAFGTSPSSPSLPRHPELIWGAKNDPNSDYPKNYLKRVLDQYHNVSPNRSTYKEIAENTDIDVLRTRCPLSFERFYTDIQATL